MLKTTMEECVRLCLRVCVSVCLCVCVSVCLYLCLLGCLLCGCGCSLTVRHVTTCRNERSGRFRRIFPSAHAFTYRPFFEETRPLNDLLADHLFHLTALVRTQATRRFQPFACGVF